MIYPVILAGGVGSRLWPLSRQHYPKQFLPLLGNKPLFEQTVAELELAGLGMSDRLLLLGYLRKVGPGFRQEILKDRRSYRTPEGSETTRGVGSGWWRSPSMVATVPA